MNRSVSNTTCRTSLRKLINMDGKRKFIDNVTGEEVHIKNSHHIVQTDTGTVKKIKGVSHK